MENIEELEIPELVGSEKNDSTTEIKLRDFQAKAVSKNVWLEESRLKTYEDWTPTKGKDYAEIMIEREAGGGKAWGTLVHDVLEKALQVEKDYRFSERESPCRALARL